MKLEVNIDKRHAFAIIILLAGVIAIVSVAAYGTNNPGVFGHSFGELEIDYTQVQERVTGNCNGQVMVGINQGGGVDCQEDDVGLQACRVCVETSDGPCGSNPGSVRCTSWVGEGDSDWSGWSITNTMDCVRVSFECQ